MYVGYTEGDGMVVMTNSDNGFALIAEIIPTLAHLYGWSAYSPEVRRFVEVPVSEKQRLVGLFQAQDSYPFRIKFDRGGLQLSISDGSPHALLTASALSLFETDNVLQIVFKSLDSGELVLGSQRTPFVRIPSRQRGR